MSIALLSAVLLLALPVQQSSSQTYHSMDSTSTAAFKRTCVGDLDDDGMPDFAVVRDNKFTFVGELAGHPWATSDLGSGVKDLALLPRTSGSAHDSLVTVGTNGVQEWTGFDDLDAYYEAAPVPAMLTYSSAWYGAKRVTTRVFPSDTRPRIAAVMSDWRSVRVLRFNGTTWVDHQLSFSAAIDEDIIDLAWVDYDGGTNPVPELTLLTTTKLRIFSVPLNLNTQGATTATHLITYATLSGWTEECMAAGAYPANHPTNPLKEWVAVVVNHSNGVQQYLTTVDYTGVHGSTLLQSQGFNPDVVAMDVAPFDGNGSMDVLLGNNASNTLWVLKNTSESSTPAFTVDVTDSTKTEVLTYASPVSGVQSNLAYPLFADVDLDGDCDVLHPERWSSMLFIHRNSTIDAAGVSAAVYTPDKEHLTIGTSIQPDSEGNLTFHASVAHPEVWPTGATHLEIAVFRKDSISAETGRTAVRVLRYSKAQCQDPELGGNPMPVEIPLDDPDLVPPGSNPPPSAQARFDNFYIFLVRLVSVNPSTGAVRWASQGLFYGLEAQPGEPLAEPDPPVIEEASDNELYLLSLMSQEVEAGYVVFLCETCQGIGNEIGTVAPLPDMPDPASGPLVIPPP